MKSVFFERQYGEIFRLSWIALLLFCALVFTDLAEAKIVLKIVGINPSPEMQQTVKVKVYLPEEIKPEHLIEKGDLDVGYDDQRKAYYVYGDYELEPEGVVEREVAMKDIWVIDEKELAGIDSEIQKITNLLVGTNMEERMSFLKESMWGNLGKIRTNQRVAESTPERHISRNRDNIKFLRAVKEDLILARSFLDDITVFPKIAVWKAFFIIIGFLAVLAVSFYFVWQKQAKDIAGSGLTSQLTEKDKMVEPQSRGANESELDDIEKIMQDEDT